MNKVLKIQIIIGERLAFFCGKALYVKELLTALVGRAKRAADILA